MYNITDTLNKLVEKKAQIEQFKADHPEMVEAIQLVEEYTALFEEACKQCQQSQPNYIPYPVPYNPYPVYPYQPIVTYDAYTTVAQGGASTRMLQ